MRKLPFLALAFTGSFLATEVGMSATIVKPASVSSSITADVGSANYLLNDNSGFAGNSLERPVGTAATLPTGTNLSDALTTYAYRGSTGQNESWTNSTSAGNPVFTFDLSGGVDTYIGSIILWQYGNSGLVGAGDEGNDTREFSLMFKTAAEGNDFSTWSADFSGTMNNIPGDSTGDNVAQMFAFSEIENVRYVGLRIDSNYLGQPGITGGGVRYGLGEVRFVDAVPEVSSVPLLSILVMFGFLLCRKR